jgi:hypothetical protein
MNENEVKKQYPIISTIAMNSFFPLAGLALVILILTINGFFKTHFLFTPEKVKQPFYIETMVDEQNGMVEVHCRLMLEDIDMKRYYIHASNCFREKSSLKGLVRVDKKEIDDKIKEFHDTLNGVAYNLKSVQEKR